MENSLWLGRTIRFLGDGEGCSEYVSILAEPTNEDTVVAALFQWLTREGKELWDHGNFEGVGAQDRATWRFIEQLRSSGCLLDATRLYHCWRLSFPKTWEAYLETCSSSHRGELRQLERRYLLSGKVTLHHATDAEQLKKGLEILVALHLKRKAALSQNSTFASSRFVDYLNAVSYRLLAEGKLQLMWLEYEGQPIAVLYDLIGIRALYGYTGGFDPECPVRTPEKLIFIAVFKRAIEQGFVAYDFLRGDEPYKMHWKAIPEECYRACIAAHKPLARFTIIALEISAFSKQMDSGFTSA